MNSWSLGRVVAGWVAVMALAGGLRAQEPPWTPGLEDRPCGHDDWTARLGVFLGPQYFLEQESLVQFSFGLEGHVRVVGPLSAGLSGGFGVVSTSTASVMAGPRLHLFRACRLSLALDARAGVSFSLSSGEAEAAALFQGGVELVHDLGDRFAILARVSGGGQPVSGRGAYLDFLVGITLFLGRTGI